MHRNVTILWRYGRDSKGGDERRFDGEVKEKRKEGQAKGRGGEGRQRERKGGWDDNGGSGSGRVGE